MLECHTQQNLTICKGHHNIDNRLQERRNKCRECRDLRETLKTFIHVYNLLVAPEYKSGYVLQSEKINIDFWKTVSCQSHAKCCNTWYNTAAE